MCSAADPDGFPERQEAVTDEQGEGTRGDEHRGRRPKLVFRLGAAAVILVGVVLAARLLVPATAVRDLVAAQLSGALGRPVTVGDARGGLLPRPWVELRDVEAAAGADGVAVGIDALRLRLRWQPLLRREVEIDRAELVRPRLDLRLPDPAAPVPAPAAAGAVAAAPAATPVTIRIEQLVLSDGSITVTRADGVPVAELRGLAEDLSLLATPDGDLVIIGTTSLDTLRLHLPSGTLGQGLRLTWRKDLRWEASAGRLKVITSELALGDLPLAVTGEIGGLTTGTPTADLRLEGGPAQLASLQGFVPTGLVPQLADLKSTGTATLTATVTGPLGAATDSLGWDLQFSLAQGMIEHPALGGPIRDIALTVAARPGRIDLVNLSARTAASRLSVRGTVTEPLTIPVYDLFVDADVDLAEAMALQPPQPQAPTVSGRASARVNVSGRADDPASLRLNGPLELTGVAVSGPAQALPVTELQARGRIDGRLLHLENLAFRQGRSDYRISGTVNDPLALLPEPLPGVPAFASVDLQVASTLLDVDEILAAGQETKTAARRVAAAGGPAAAPAPATAPPAALDYLTRVSGRAEARIAKLVMRGVDLTELQGTARLDRGRIELDGATARVYGGTAALDGTVDLADPLAGRLDLRLKVSNARAEQYFAESTLAGRFTGLASALSGAVDVTASLQGALDDTLGLDLKTLTSLGDVGIRQARFSGLPLQDKLVTLLDAPQLQTVSVADLLQPFRIEKGRLTVDKLRIQAGTVGILASGWQSLEGEIGAHLLMTLPPGTAQGLRRQLPAQMADLLLDAEGTALELPVSVSGRATDPVVRLDTDKLAAAAAARAEAKLARETDKLKQQAIKEAARGLQDLLKLPADSASAAADSGATPTLQDVGRSLLDRLKQGKKGGG